MRDLPLIKIPSLPGAGCNSPEYNAVWWDGKSEDDLRDRKERDWDSLIAKAICRDVCPVRAECLGWAVKENQTLGIWGGLEPAERKTISRRTSGRINLSDGTVVWRCRHLGWRLHVTSCHKCPRRDPATIK